MKRRLFAMTILGAGLALASGAGAQTDAAGPAPGGAPTTPTQGPQINAPTQGPQINAPTAPTQAALDAEARIRVLLSAYDGFPTEAELLEVSAEAPAILMAIAGDASALPTMRLRAIDALGYFDRDEVAAFLGDLLKGGASELETHHAITALMKTRGEGGLSAVGPFLAHDDAQMRVTAVIAVGTHGGRGGKALLKKRQGVEKSAFVRETIEKHLSR